MKRSVAIQGPTPMFVRWAIEWPCPLRELIPERLPETTFRQLRTIREISLALAEQRVSQGFCLHPFASQVEPNAALGFSVQEGLEWIGGREVVERNCPTCPANAALMFHKGSWAGCFGFLSSDLRYRMDQMIRGEYSRQFAETDSQPSTALGATRVRHDAGFNLNDPSASGFDLKQLVNQLEVEFENPETVESRLRPKDSNRTEPASNGPSWVRLWQQRQPDAAQFKFISSVLRHVVQVLRSRPKPTALEPERPALSPTSDMTTDLEHLIEAVERCLKFQLTMVLELVPAGFSDGLHWRLNPHCQICKETWPERERPCPTCGPVGRYQNEIKLKVLGLRPYLKLADIVGREEVERMLRATEP